MGTICRWRYPRPILDRAGQQVFWDRQASTYDQADMTIDNVGELMIVQSLCADFVQRGFTAEDVITLGGANGCRDPLVVLAELKDHRPSQVIFNDLSEAMVNMALGRTLSSHIRNGYCVRGIHGPIHNVAYGMPVLPRRVILGVYSAHALVQAHPSEGQPYSGLEEYIRNSAIIGDCLIVEAMGLHADQYKEQGSRVDLSAGNATEHLQTVLSTVASWEADEQFVATRVIGTHSKKPGYFISHWFSEKGIRKLVGKCILPARIKNMTVTKCAKGFVLCIDPIDPPRGIITMLNNVLGNVLPHEQAETLRAINRIS